MKNMSNFSTHERKRSSLVIKTSTISMLIICFLMILPDDVFSIGSIYRSLTPTSIAYNWLNYEFGIIQVFILLIGVCETIRLNKKAAPIIFFVMLVRELFVLFFQSNSLFKASAYEMYLTVAVGYAFVLWAEGAMGGKEGEEKLFVLFLVTNMLTLYINFAMGGSGGLIAGRYHSSNLDVGGTGVVCVLCFLFFCFLKDKKWHHYGILILSIIGLLLSGSRANLLFLLLVLAARAIYIATAGANIKFKVNRRKFMNRLFIGIVVLVVAIVIIYTNRNEIINAIVGSRFHGIFNLQTLSRDDSFDGRTKSLEAGLDVLKSHPLGISGYFINLQTEIRMRNYPTFPHSTLLSLYLLFGPIVLIVIYLWLKIMKRDKQKASNKYFWMLLYFLVSNIIYGGPITNFKLIFIYGMITRLAYLELKSQGIEESMVEQQ